MIYTRYTAMDVPGWYFPSGNSIKITHPDGYFYSIPQSDGNISAPAGSTICISNWSVYALDPPDGMTSVGFFIEYDTGKSDLVGQVAAKIGANSCGSGCCSVIPVGATLFNVSTKYKNLSGAWVNGTSSVGYKIDSPTTTGSSSTGSSEVTVSVNSSPQGADVIVNDVPTGKATPCTLDLVPGVYSIEFHKGDHYQEMITIEVKPNTPSSIEADLDIISQVQSPIQTTYKPPTDWSIEESEVENIYGVQNQEANSTGISIDSNMIFVIGAVTIGAFILLRR